jgi:GH43 family beta-xylosidase
LARRTRQRLIVLGVAITCCSSGVGVIAATTNGGAAPPAQTLVPPSVEIVAPKADDHISNHFVLSASASVDTDKVVYFVDGRMLGVAAKSNVGWIYDWDTRTSVGPHTLTAQATSKIGFSATSSPVKTTVDPANYNTPLMGIEPGGNIFWANGNYYVITKWAGEPRLRMARRKWLSDFSSIDISKQQVIWDARSTPSAAGWINWPAYIYRVRGKWYIYFNGAPKDPPDFSDRMYVIESKTDDPMGTWIFRGRVGPDSWTLGAAPFEWGGRLYMVTSTREGHTPGTHHALAIAEMSSPTRIIGNWVPLSDPTYDWEQYGPGGPGQTPINEIDQTIVHNGRVHAFFSASHVQSTNHNVGRLTYSGSGSPLDRTKWTKVPSPVLSRTPQIAGPGQSFFMKSPDGTTDYISYAYWNTPTQLSPRPIGLMPIGWDANNDPVISPPADPGTIFQEPWRP